MNRRKILVLILCAMMTISAFTGCSKETEEAPPEAETQPSVSEPSPTELVEVPDTEAESRGIDFNAAYSAYSPDTVMMTIGGYAVAWDELFFYMCSSVNSILQYSDILNWSDILYEDVTYADIVLEYSGDTALTYKAIEYGAELFGVTLDKDAIDLLREDFDSTAELFGGEEEFLNMLWEANGISSRELFDYLRSIGPLADAVFTEMYGKNGALLSDEDVAVYTIYDGYLAAKHILRLKTGEDEDTSLAEAEEILALLESYDGDDFETFFDELMWGRSDDAEALLTFPNGYLFQYGDMVPEFYDVCGTLEIGAYSGIVETSYGYHIIYRKPVNFDEIPIYYYQQYMYGEISQKEYESMIIRNLAALGLFDSEIYGWRDSLSVEYTAAYESMEISKIFDVGEK